MIPNDLPPWTVVYQQTQRWMKVGVFEAMTHDLRVILRLANGRDTSGVWRGIMRDIRSNLTSRLASGHDFREEKSGSD